MKQSLSPGSRSAAPKPRLNFYFASLPLRRWCIGTEKLRTLAAVVAIGLTSALAWVGLAPEPMKTAKAGKLELPTGATLELRSAPAFATTSAPSRNVPPRRSLPQGAGRGYLGSLGSVDRPSKESMLGRFAEAPRMTE
jgi:hypothetical protein